jgi:hypothetical protein
MSDLIGMNFATFLQNNVKVSISGMFNFVKYLLLKIDSLEKNKLKINI